MAFSETDLRDILQYLRRQVLRAGLREIDARIMSDFSPSESAFRDLMYYLKSFADLVRFSSDEEYVSTLRRLQRYVRTEEGSGVEGIEVELSPAEREQFNVERIDLSLRPGMGELLADLDAIMQTITAEVREFGE